jgi:hypothetical protein
MKLTRALVVSSVLGFGSLVGCGGTDVAEPVGEDSPQSIEQALCAPLTGATAVPTDKTCNHNGFVFTHYKTDFSGCILYNCVNSSWQSKRINENNSGCTTVVASFCS